MLAECQFPTANRIQQSKWRAYLRAVKVRTASMQARQGRLQRATVTDTMGGTEPGLCGSHREEPAQHSVFVAQSLALVNRAVTTRGCDISCERLAAVVVTWGALCFGSKAHTHGFTRGPLATNQGLRRIWANDNGCSRRGGTPRQRNGSRECASRCQSAKLANFSTVLGHCRESTSVHESKAVLCIRLSTKCGRKA
jgi:hypothetical protein